MNRIIVLLIILLNYYSVGSQNIYYSSIKGSPTSTDGLRTVIGIFNPTTCFKEEIYVDTTFITPPFEWTEIAVCPDNNFYGITHQGLYQIDVLNRTFIKLVEADQTQRWHQGLFCTKDSILIFGERDIYGYHLSSGRLEHFGRLPITTSIAANLFTYNGKLMTIRNTSLIVVDTINPLNSYVECIVNEPSTSAGLLSLTEVAISCDSVAIFAYYTGGEIFLFDPKTCSLTFHCNLSSLPGESYQGSQPNFMFMPPEPCKISIDLDYFDETLSGLDYSDTIFCDLPNQYLFSTIELYSDKQWDSLKVWIDNGPIEITLEGNSSVFANLQGSGTSQLKYISIGTSDISQIAPLLSDLVLSGIIPPGITSMRIGFATWAKNLVSDTAYAYITLIGKSVSAGEGGLISLCKNDTPLNLTSLVSSGATQNGFWIPSTSTNDTFNPMNDIPGYYFYIVNDPYCAPDSAIFDISTYPLPVLGLEERNYICPGDTVLLEVELENAYVTWSDGTTGHFLYINESDTITVEVFDEFGCTFTDTVYVLYKDDCILKELFIPNIFSPDQNQINDYWIIASDPIILFFEVTIFDRWGNALYHEKANSIKWNGNANNNRQVPPGVYTYSLSIETIDHNRYHKFGDITLIR